MVGVFSGDANPCQLDTYTSQESIEELFRLSDYSVADILNHHTSTVINSL